VRALGAAEFFNLSSEDGQKKATNSVDYLILTADANNMPYNLYLSLLHECGTLIMLGIPNDEIKFSPLFVMRALRVHGSLIGGIQDVKDVLGWLPRRTGARSR
jgi:alcohol dehydrogenase (NADP+)